MQKCQREWKTLSTKLMLHLARGNLKKRRKNENPHTSIKVFENYNAPKNQAFGTIRSVTSGPSKRTVRINIVWKKSNPATTYSFNHHFSFLISISCFSFRCNFGFNFHFFSIWFFLLSFYSSNNQSTEIKIN